VKNMMIKCDWGKSLQKALQRMEVISATKIGGTKVKLMVSKNKKTYILRIYGSGIVSFKIEEINELRKTVGNEITRWVLERLEAYHGDELRREVFKELIKVW